MNTDYFIQHTTHFTDEQLSTACSSGPITPLRTFPQNYTAVIRGTFPVHVEVAVNIAAILPESELSNADIQWLTDFLVQTIKDMGITVEVANRMQFRVWLLLPSENHNSPDGWVPDTTIESDRTPLGTKLSMSVRAFRKDFQFNENWTFRAPQTASFTFRNSTTVNEPRWGGFQAAQTAQSKVDSGAFGTQLAPPEKKSSSYPTATQSQTWGSFQQTQQTQPAQSKAGSGTQNQTWGGFQQTQPAQPAQPEKKSSSFFTYPSAQSQNQPWGSFQQTQPAQSKWCAASGFKPNTNPQPQSQQSFFNKTPTASKFFTWK